MRVTIVGAGIVGLSTAWALAKRGHRVTLLEQGPIPNPLSASGDEHRMIRRAYGGQDGYTRLMSDAFAAWDELWADLGQNHFARTGILTLSQREGDFGDQFRAGLDRTGFSYELMTGPATAERYPFLEAAPIRYAFLSPEGGVLFCQRIAGGLLAWLRENDVDVRSESPVADVDAPSGRVTAANGDMIEADRVVVAAGAWVLNFFPDLAGTLSTYRTANAYLEPPADLRPAWEGAPAILDVGGPIDGYVIPPVDGAGMKVGAGVHKRPAGPDDDRAPLPGEGERLRDLFAPPLARIAEYRVTRVNPCAYTFTADETFFTAERGRALVVSACSGHGYKFGAAIGCRTAAFLDGGETFGDYRHWLRAEAPSAP